MRVIILKKRWLNIFCALLIFLFAVCVYMSSMHILQVFEYKNASLVVVIDPGHGGIDGGTISKNGVKESDINLEISLKLKKFIEQGGGKVILIRDSDKGLYSAMGTIRKKKQEDLVNRRNIIDKSGADLVISIHQNYFSESYCFGAQTFYPKYPAGSKILAEYIQEELVTGIDNGNKRVTKQKNDIILLKNCVVPTVLVECGFLSNPNEEKLLQDNEYQNKIAWNIYLGILRYLSTIQS